MPSDASAAFDASAVDAQVGGDIVAADGPGSLTVEAYCQQYAERSCASEVLCAPQSARTSAAACADERASRCLALARAWQIPALANGRLAFDGAAAAACLDSVDKGPCGVASPGAETCQRIWQPRVADGGTCLDDGECRGGICDRRGRCPGVCASPRGPGADCSAYPCDAAVASCGPGRLCVAKLRGVPCRQSSECAGADFCQAPEDGLPCPVSGSRDRCVCAGRADEGGACSFREQCLPELGCAGGQCRTIVAAAGEPCSYAQGVGCGAGLACNITDGRREALAGTCGPMRAAGASCYWVECERGLDCAGGSISETPPRQGACTAKALPGEPCRAFGCTLGHFCDQGRCVARPGAGQACVAVGGGQGFCYGSGVTCDHYTGGACTAPPAVGQPCWESCDGNGHCDHNATNTCLAKRAPGEACLRDEQCASNSCTLSVCAPPCSAAAL
jgi:hypothetical protein